MFKKIIFTIVFIFMFSGLSYAALIEYVDTGKEAQEMNIAFSTNHGVTWQRVIIKPGQSFRMPNETTNLSINNVPYNPKKNYKIKDGHVEK